MIAEVNKETKKRACGNWMLLGLASERTVKDLYWIQRERSVFAPYETGLLELISMAASSAIHDPSRGWLGSGASASAGVWS